MAAEPAQAATAIAQSGYGAAETTERTGGTAHCTAYGSPDAADSTTHGVTGTAARTYSATAAAGA
jgi:hypothetical protein